MQTNGLLYFLPIPIAAINWYFKCGVPYAGAGLMLYKYVSYSACAHTSADLIVLVFINVVVSGKR